MNIEKVKIHILSTLFIYKIRIRLINYSFFIFNRNPILHIICKILMD